MVRLENFIDRLFTNHRWAVHFLFWLLVLFLYVIFFGRKSNNYIQTFFFVGLLIPVTIGTTYFLNYFLVPRFLMRERYAHFILYFVYTIIGSLYLEMIIALLTLAIVAEWHIANVSPASIDIFFLTSALLMVVFFSMAIKLLLHWRKSKEDYQKLMREKVEAELKFLKTQLNPHFLFNTLNNLYCLSIEKSDKTPRAILALSEMLDYVLQDGKSIFVPLEKELKQIENYMALELLRYEGRVQVVTDIRGDSVSHRIGPMILITLIENAFKHGVMQVTSKSCIKIGIACETEKINITIANSWKKKQLGNGIGLKNLQSQLELLYPQRYTLLIETKRDEFLVNLILPGIK